MGRQYYEDYEDFEEDTFAEGEVAVFADMTREEIEDIALDELNEKLSSCLRALQVEAENCDIVLDTGTRAVAGLYALILSSKAR